MAVDPPVGARYERRDLTWPHGDTHHFEFSFNPDVIDLDNVTWRATIRRKASHATNWPFTIDTTNAAAGYLVLTTPSDADLPGVGVYDLRYTDTDGDVTIYGGKVVLTRTVS